MKTLQQELEEFRKSYDSTMVSVYEDFMVYATPVGMSIICASAANKLIKKLELNIRAIANHSWPSDTFVIEANK